MPETFTAPIASDLNQSRDREGAIERLFLNRSLTVAALISLRFIQMTAYTRFTTTRVRSSAGLVPTVNAVCEARMA